MVDNILNNRYITMNRNEQQEDLCMTCTNLQKTVVQRLKDGQPEGEPYQKNVCMMTKLLVSGEKSNIIECNMHMGKLKGE